jgi:hypothetical protein
LPKLKVSRDCCPVHPLGAFSATTVPADSCPAESTAIPVDSKFPDTRMLLQ